MQTCYKMCQTDKSTFPFMKKVKINVDMSDDVSNRQKHHPFSWNKVYNLCKHDTGCFKATEVPSLFMKWCV